MERIPLIHVKFTKGINTKWIGSKWISLKNIYIKIALFKNKQKLFITTRYKYLFFYISPLYYGTFGNIRTL